MDKEAEANARAVVYRLLSKVFLQEPTVSFLRGLADRESLGVLSKVGGGWISQLPEMDLNSLAEELSTEYARLFVGPGPHAYPYESMYAGVGSPGSLQGEAQLYGEATIAVERFYLEAGIVPSPSFSGLPDHAGLELEFMSRLAAREASQWERKETDQVISSLQLQLDFLTQHLGAWLPRFSRLVGKFEPHPFYRTIVVATGRFVRVEMQTVSGLLRESLASREVTHEPHQTATTIYSHR